MKTIYMIKNDIDGMVYIGNTKKSIRIRFQQHVREKNRERSKWKPLYRAMNDYGVHHFECIEIEKCEDELSGAREKYWISVMRGKGLSYNIADGGEGRPKFDHGLIGKSLEDNPYSSDAADQFGCCRDTVRTIARENGIKMRNKRADSSSVKVKQITIDGKELNTFNSLREAARWCFDHGICNISGSVHTHIGECVKGQRKTAYGFRWIQVEDTD